MSMATSSKAPTPPLSNAPAENIYKKLSPGEKDIYIKVNILDDSICITTCTLYLKATNMHIPQASGQDKLIANRLTSMQNFPNKITPRKSRKSMNEVPVPQSPSRTI